MKISKLSFSALALSLLVSIISLVCVLQLNNKTTNATGTTQPVDITGQVSSEVANQLKTQLDTSVSAAVTSSVKTLTDQIAALQTQVKNLENKATVTPTATPVPTSTPVTTTKPTTPPTAVTTKQVKVTTGLNIRAKAGLTQTITGALNNGDTITYLNESSNVDGHNWIKIKTASGLTGWIAQEYVTDK